MIHVSAFLLKTNRHKKNYIQAITYSEETNRFSLGSKYIEVGKENKQYMDI